MFGSLSDRLDGILKRPAIQQLEREIQAEQVEQRRRVAAELQELEADLPRIVPAKRRAIDEAAAAIARVRAQLNEAQAAEQAAQREYWNATFPIEHRIDELRADLVRSASPQIADFLTELVLLEDAARVAVTHRETKNRLTGTITVFSNLEQVNEHVTAIRAARVAAIAMRLLPLDEVAISARLNNLRVTLPTLEDLGAARGHTVRPDSAA